MPPQNQPQFDGQNAVAGYTLFHGADGQHYYLKGENLSDDQITQKVSALRAASQPLQPPDTNAQARQTLQNIPQFTSSTDALRANLSNAQSGIGPQGKAYNEYQRQAGQLPAQTALGMATGGMFPAVKGAGLLQNILPFLGRTLTSGAAMGAGTIAGGGTPQEAKGAAEGGVIGQPIAEAAGAVLPWMAKGLKNSAVSQYEKALAPTTKINKAITQEIAPQMIQRGVRGSLEGIEQGATQKISELNPQLNAAYQQAGQSTPKLYTKAQMISEGADGYLNRAVKSQIPLNMIEGQEPLPAMEGGYTKGTPITQPIEVSRNPQSGKYTLYSGNHRVQQAVVNGQTSIPAFIEGATKKDLQSFAQQGTAKIAGAGNQVISDLENLKQSYMPEGNIAQPQAVSAIEGVQGIVKQYGSDISPNSLRRLRQIFEDPVAKAGGYAGTDLSTNYTLNAQQAAADSIRGILNSNPNIGTLNKEISFWLDVQRVTSQSALRRTGQEGGLLKTLWPLGAAIAGGGAGFAGGGAEAGLGAAATTMLATQAVKAARSPAWRTLDAVAKDRIANALARGDVAETSSLLGKLIPANIGAARQQSQGGLPWQRQQQSAQPLTQ